MTPPKPSTTCPVCKRVSYHPQDIENQFCAACGIFYSPAVPRFYYQRRHDGPTGWAVCDSWKPEGKRDKALVHDKADAMLFAAFLNGDPSAAEYRDDFYPRVGT